MRVSLAQTGRAEPHPPPRPLLDPSGARVILGGVENTTRVAPICAAAHTLFGPRGVCLASETGPLIVTDTGHHRLLIWRRVPGAHGAAADVLLGQPTFAEEGRNAKGEIDAATLAVPTGVAVGDGILAVADAWNHRVLIWRGVPERSNRPADVVLGQATFSEGRANRGHGAPRADTLNWCYGVAIHAGRLLVADTGNRRVLVWNRIPAHHGEPADLVLGQPSFDTRDENGGGARPGAGMRWPHAIAAAADSLFVADAGNSRVMVWSNWPQQCGAPCDFVLGQSGFDGTDHNRGAYHPSASTSCMPYGLTVQPNRLIVADTANSRLLGFELRDLAMGARATLLAGQTAFGDRGDNRWRAPAADSLCWPYAVAGNGRTVAIADSGNNRVLLWDLA